MQELPILVCMNSSLFQRLLLGAVCLFLVPHVASAQLVLRGYNFRPTGEFGAVMKSTFSADIGFSRSYDDSPFRSVISATFIKMTPRMDTFPTYVIQSGGNGTFVLPGKQVFSKYNLVLLYFGFDYSPYFNEKFAVYGGFDLVAGGASVSYTNDVPTFKSESYDGGGVIAGIRLRIGADYYFNDTWSILVNANRMGFLLTEPAGLYAANDYGIGLRYTFN